MHANLRFLQLSDLREQMSADYSRKYILDMMNVALSL